MKRQIQYLRRKDYGAIVPNKETVTSKELDEYFNYLMYEI
jgi:hypothetical protein